MLRIREAIVVEGRYDKNRIKQILDAVVIETSGFGIFKSDELRVLLRRLCDTTGLVILTDSDAAGFVIRNYLKGVLPGDGVKHAYIPQIEGKERRKDRRSKEGFLGVEGVSDACILNALRNAGVTFCGEDTAAMAGAGLTKQDFYQNGLSGGQDSTRRRGKIISALGLPRHMTANALMEAVNLLLTREEYDTLVSELFKQE